MLWFCRRRASPKVLGNRLGILTQILTVMDCQIFFYISEKYLNLLGKIFVSAHISNRIYLLRNCFSNYLYFKDKYINLKGTGRLLFVLMLKTLIFCKFLNFTSVFTKKKQFQSLHTIFCIRKLISVQYNQLILPLIDFEEHY